MFWLISNSNTFTISTIILSSTEMGPTSIDLELSLLSPANGGSLSLCEAFLSFCGAILATRRHFELINAYLGVFLAKGGAAIANNADLAAQMAEIRDADAEAWKGVQHQLRQSLCVIKFLRSATL